MAAGSTLVASKQASKQASKHSITVPFFLVKSTIAYFSKAYSARFYTGGVRLFVLPEKQCKKIFSYNLLLSQLSRQEVDDIA